MGINERSRPIASLMSETVSDLAYLVQTEIRLARAEVGEKLSRAANGGVYLGMAAVMSITGLVVLLFAAVRWLEIAGVPDQWSMLIVGALVLGTAGVLGMIGARSLKSSELRHDRTIEQVRADFSVAKEHMR
jgi:uncharacterized membrane protein YqjE